MNRRQRTTLPKATAIFLILAVAFVLVILLLFSRSIEQRFFPVLVDWSIKDAYIENGKLHVIGSQRKIRGCKFISPIRAVTASGEYLLLTSESRTSGHNWAPNSLPRNFGPWVIEIKSMEPITFYSEHYCHSFWPVFSTLGTINPNLVSKR
jgi:hypothetical protein